MQITLIKKMGVVVMLMISLAGCASVPVMPDASKKKVLQSLPPANKSYIYLVRTFGEVPEQLIDITIDNKVEAKLAVGTFYVGEYAPGMHDIIIGAVYSGRKSVHDLASGIKLTCLPGKSYYYRVFNAFIVSALTEEEGIKLVNNADMVRDSKVTSY